MKKMLLLAISILILVFSSVLVYNILSEESVETKQGNQQEETSSSKILQEIDNSLLDEYDEIEIGEMI